MKCHPNYLAVILVAVVAVLVIVPFTTAPGLTFIASAALPEAFFLWVLLALTLYIYFRGRCGTYCVAQTSHGLKILLLPPQKY